jgi:hypothetical protein
MVTIGDVSSQPGLTVSIAPSEVAATRP